MRRLIALGLLLAAVATSWLVYQLRREEAPPPLVGPPRSDYSLEEFQLLVLGEDGRESFSVSGPLLTRHPYLGTLTLANPDIRFPDERGGRWRATSASAWISRGAEQVRLLEDVLVAGTTRGGGRVELRTPVLNLFPEEGRLATEDAVTITDPTSILRGRGLQADLNQRRFELLSEVTARYENQLQ